MNETELEELGRLWSLDSNSSKNDAERWDARAEKFAARELPTSENAIAIRVIEDEGMVCEGDDVIDIGCGGGRFSFAIEQMGANVTGTDFSSKMIENAQKSAIERESKVHFVQENWHTVDLEEKDWVKRFDLVLANMTPAVGSVDTFLKLCEASKRWVVMTRPVGRTNSIKDGIQDLLRSSAEGAEKKKPTKMFGYAFATAWLCGYFPEVRYFVNTRHAKRPLEEAIETYTSSPDSEHELSDADKAAIKAYLEGIAIDGVVHETSEVKIAALYWRVDTI